MQLPSCEIPIGMRTSRRLRRLGHCSLLFLLVIGFVLISSYHRSMFACREFRQIEKIDQFKFIFSHFHKILTRAVQPSMKFVTKHWWCHCSQHGGNRMPSGKVLRKGSAKHLPFVSHARKEEATLIWTQTTTRRNKTIDILVEEKDHHATSLQQFFELALSLRLMIALCLFPRSVSEWSVFSRCCRFTWFVYSDGSFIGSIWIFFDNIFHH